MLSPFAVKTLIGLGLTGTVVTTTALSIPKSKNNQGPQTYSCRNSNMEWYSCEKEVYKKWSKENSQEGY